MPGLQSYRSVLLVSLLAISLLVPGPGPEVVHPASASGGASAPGQTLYFHYVTVPEGAVDRLTGGSIMDPNPPTSPVPAAVVFQAFVGGANPRTIYDANFMSTDPVTFTDQNVTVTWYTMVTNPTTLLFDETWEVFLYEVDGGTYNLLADTGPNGVSFTPVGGGAIEQRQVSFPGISVSGKPLVVRLTPFYLDTGQGMTLLYDAPDAPSRVDIGDVGGGAPADGRLAIFKPFDQQRYDLFFEDSMEVSGQVERFRDPVIDPVDVEIEGPYVVQSKWVLTVNGTVSGGTGFWDCTWVSEQATAISETVDSFGPPDEGVTWGDKNSCRDTTIVFDDPGFYRLTLEGVDQETGASGSASTWVTVSENEGSTSGKMPPRSSWLTYPDTVGDGVLPQFDIEETWITNDDEYLFVGIKVVDIPVQAQTTMDFYYNVEFRPDWSTEWGQDSTTLEFRYLSVQALYDPAIGAAWAAFTGGAAPSLTEHDFNLYWNACCSTTMVYGDISKLTRSSVNPATDTIWWVIPRDPDLVSVDGVGPVNGVNDLCQFRTALDTGTTVVQLLGGPASDNSMPSPGLCYTFQDPDPEMEVFGSVPSRVEAGKTYYIGAWAHSAYPEYTCYWEGTSNVHFVDGSSDPEKSCWTGFYVDNVGTGGLQVSIEDGEGNNITIPFQTIAEASTLAPTDEHVAFYFDYDFSTELDRRAVDTREEDAVPFGTVLDIGDLAVGFHNLTVVWVEDSLSTPAPIGGSEIDNVTVMFEVIDTSAENQPPDPVEGKEKQAAEKEGPVEGVNETVASEDSDRDGVEDRVDTCMRDGQADQVDRDGDGVGDACDGDRDGDGRINGADNCPDVRNASQSDQDGDGVGDACDSDMDGDGRLNEQDNCPLYANSGQEDTDGDGLGDACDGDRDGDGVPDVSDAFPDDADEWSDFDGDGIGDNADLDDDGDGALDVDEVAFGTDPLDAGDNPAARGLVGVAGEPLSSGELNRGAPGLGWVPIALLLVGLALAVRRCP